MALTTATKTLVDALLSTSAYSAKTGLDSHSTYHGTESAALKEIYGILRYKAKVSQSGTSAPVAVVLENTLGETPVWSRSAAGSYALSTTGSVFTSGKVFLLLHDNPSGGGLHVARFVWQSVTELDLYYMNTSTHALSGADNLMSECYVSIEVYP